MQTVADDAGLRPHRPDRPLARRHGAALETMLGPRLHAARQSAYRGSCAAPARRAVSAYPSRIRGTNDGWGPPRRSRAPGRRARHGRLAAMRNGPRTKRARTKRLPHTYAMRNGPRTNRARTKRLPRTPNERARAAAPGAPGADRYAPQAPGAAPRAASTSARTKQPATWSLTIPHACMSA